MLTGPRLGARGCRKALSGPGRWCARRLHLFVNALVDKFGALIEIFVRAALLGAHPAFPRRARVRHRSEFVTGPA